MLNNLHDIKKKFLDLLHPKIKDLVILTDFYVIIEY